MDFYGGGTVFQDHKKKQRSEIMRALSLMSQIGITIIICVAVGVLLGKFLDNLLGTSPWLLLVFTLFGSGAAFKSIFDIAKRG
jgi:ATP synthase protein I